MRWTAWTTSCVTLLILLQTDGPQAANILALFGQGSRSHNNVYISITMALASRGHQLTVVTPIPLNPTPPNYTQIDTSSANFTHFSNFNASKKVPVLGLFQSFVSLAWDNCNSTLSHPQVKALMDPSIQGNNFDLILTSTVLTECFYAFAHIYNVPIVLISPNGPMFTANSATGNIPLPSFVPHVLLSYSDHMTFSERLTNMLFLWGSILFYNSLALRNMNAVMKIAFGENVPSTSELERHISLVLVNTHYSFNYPQPLVPMIVEVGGVHIKPPKSLPKELKNFLDDAKEEGAIYFSLGSILKSSALEVETRNAFLRAFLQLKQRVLWKWEGDNPIPGQTKSIRLEKWLPQQDVLAHPNVKLFITHGGLLSLQEATMRGVPVVGIPFYGDQEANMNRITNLNAGVTLDANNLTTESILIAINLVLRDPKYMQSMKKAQSIVNDRPQQPLETAMYWVEYVLRHKGCDHMKSASIHLYWFQLYLLDVVFVVAVVPSIVLFTVIYFTTKWLMKKSTSRHKSNHSSKKTQ